MENNIDELAEIGLQHFLSSSKFWKKCYDEASDIVKRHYKYYFGANYRRQTILIDQDEDDEIVEAMFNRVGEAMSKFTLDDWNYLIERTHYPMMKIGLIKLRDEHFPPAGDGKSTANP